MEIPARIDLVGDRGVAYISPLLTFVGQDFTGAAYRAQLRQEPDASGSPIVSMTTTTSSSAQGVKLMYAGSATVSAHIAAGRLSSAITGYVNPATGVNYVAGDTVTLSQLRLRINASNMTSPTMTAASQVGDDLDLSWDILITPSGGDEDKWAYGAFTVRGTVTQ